jgi:hypothetical protein
MTTSKSIDSRIKNIISQTLVNQDNVFLPPLYIKLSLMGHVVKDIDQNGSGFLYIKQNFPRIREARIKDEIFLGPQIREIMREAHWMKLQVKLKVATWRTCKAVSSNFLGNFEAENKK